MTHDELRKRIRSALEDDSPLNGDEIKAFLRYAEEHREELDWLAAEMLAALLRDDREDDYYADDTGESRA